ncbi:MAG: dihydroneopterin aldolase family protein [Desulfurococcaceae archaeon]|nr:dihydroneopterin aldolase family protein [Desulfurococcaceae archaeon]
MEDPAAKYFSPKVTSRDRAVFEAGIAIGTAVHQFTGTPLKSLEDVRVLEEAIKRALLAQPFRERVEVKIHFERSPSGGPYDYTTLRARDMDLRVVVKYGSCRVTARLKYIKELDYALAYIEDIEEEVK